VKTRENTPGGEGNRGKPPSIRIVAPGNLGRIKEHRLKSEKKEEKIRMKNPESVRAQSPPIGRRKTEGDSLNEKEPATSWHQNLGQKGNLAWRKV